MTRYEWIVMTDCDRDHRSEYDHWYDEAQLPDLLAVPGIVGARRFDLAPCQSDTDPATGAPIVTDRGPLSGQLPFVAISEFEACDVKALFDEIRASGGNAGNGHFPASARYQHPPLPAALT